MCRLRTVERRRWSGDLEVGWRRVATRSEEHTSELQSQSNLVCRLLLEKKKSIIKLPDIQSLRLATFKGTSFIASAVYCLVTIHACSFLPSVNAPCIIDSTSCSANSVS